jgi:hypothetical protein
MTPPIARAIRPIDLTRDFQARTTLALSWIPMQTQNVNLAGTDNPPYPESHQYCRTSKRISAYG